MSVNLSGSKDIIANRISIIKGNDVIEVMNVIDNLDNVDNTSDLLKPISNATQTALNLKAPLNNPTFTGTINGITKDMVGLNNVDNTSDLLKTNLYCNTGRAKFESKVGESNIYWNNFRHK